MNCFGEGMIAILFLLGFIQSIIVFYSMRQVEKAGEKLMKELEK